MSDLGRLQKEIADFKKGADTSGILGFLLLLSMN